MSRANETAPPSLARLRAVYQELCAQIERVASLGVTISHLDSHNHVHTRPLLFPALKEVTEALQHPQSALVQEFLFVGPTASGRTALEETRRTTGRCSPCIRTHTTDAFTELITYYRRGRRPTDGRSARIELMVHPGADAAADETAVLESDWRLDGSAGQLISYTQLA